MSLFRFQHLLLTSSVVHFIEKKTKNRRNHAFHRLVELTRYANNETTLDLVNVYLNIMVIRMLNVDQNVFPTRNVHQIALA